MIYKKIIFSLLLLLLLNACKKEKTENVINYEAAMEGVEFFCSDIDTIMYFKGILNGDTICYSRGVDNYIERTISLTSFFTPTNNTTTSTIPAGATKFFEFGFVQEERVSFLEDFIIKSPVEDNTDISLIEMLDKYIVLGELPLKNAAQKGFEIIIRIPYHPPNVSVHYLYEKSSLYGGQGEDSFFIIDHIEKTEYLGSQYYIVEARIQCDLYTPETTSTDRAFWGELREGVLKFVIKGS